MTWQDRVKVELEELSDKLSRLNAFLDDDAFEELDADAKYWLLRQKLAMTEYKVILECRLT